MSDTKDLGVSSGALVEPAASPCAARSAAGALRERPTPGPWEYREDKFGIYVTSPGLFYGDGERPFDILEDGTEADFRLIAAAPELLAALKEIVAIADRKTDEFDRARAAIAKASKQADGPDSAPNDNPNSSTGSVP